MPPRSEGAVRRALARDCGPRFGQGENCKGTCRMTIRLAVRVEGIVQGVGFRPFVYALATRLGLGGSVSNDSQGVHIELEGSRNHVNQFLDALVQEAPPLASIESVTSSEARPKGDKEFVIAASVETANRLALVSPDGSGDLQVVVAAYRRGVGAFAIDGDELWRRAAPASPSARVGCWLAERTAAC